jgi:hypothetical protein
VLEALPESFANTRQALHALAEHVIAPARYRADGRIGLVPTANGFGTPAFGDRERVRVEGIELVHERPGTTTRIGITTLHDAAAILGIPLGAPAEVYTPETTIQPDVALAVDAAGAKALAEWYALGAAALDALLATYSAHEPSGMTLWPEHFDLAAVIGDADAGTKANYGASPGDAVIETPYLYVGPWEAARRVGPFGAHPFGAALTYEELRAAPDAKARATEFMLECAALLVGQP